MEALRAVAAGAGAVRVTWLAPPQRRGRLTHYTLYIRELGKYDSTCTCTCTDRIFILAIVKS